MSNEDQKSNDLDGFIPKYGYMTDAEISRRIRCKDRRNVRRALVELGVEHVVVAQKYLFNLESFNKLFWEAD